MGVRKLSVAVTAALVTGALVPAAASAFSAVTMFSEPGDYVGGGVERLYHSGNAQISIAGNDESLSIDVSGGNRGDSFSLDFAAPPGERLQDDHVYVRAQRASFREAGRPGIDIGGDGRGCNEIEGSFQVTDLATDADHKVIRFAALYEQHCEGGTPALFGEVRYGYAAPAGPAAMPTHVRWPIIDFESTSTVDPVTLMAWSSPVTVTGATLAGSDAGAFSIEADECTGMTLQPGQSCEVWVGFAPGEPGTRRAALHFARSDGALTEVELEGHALGGRTRFVMDSDQGDWVGGGVDRTYTPANAQITARGTRRFVEVSVSGDDGSWWTADFEPADGDILAAGKTYPNATRYPFNGSGNGIDVTGSGRGCNTQKGEFAVQEARFDQDGDLRTLALTYEQHCEGGDPALRGTIEVHAGDTTPPPPWADGGPLEGGTWTPPADTDAAPGAPPYDAATQPTIAPARTTRGTKGDVLTLSASERAACGARRLERGRPRTGTGGGDRLRASGGVDLLAAGPGNDTVWAGRGDDCVAGGSGKDRLYGGSGRDVVLGGTGADVLVGGPGRDLLICGSGRDTAYVGRGDRSRGCERLRRR